MTSNHDGVSCDSCRKSNFRSLRYKCLICFDYDLCSTCYDTGSTSSRHTINHPMQCIVAKNDYDLYYAGESINSDQPLSLTCPLCGILGFTDSSLLEHVTSDHPSSDNDDSSAGVVCPICGVEANQLTYDFASHLSMEHRAPRDSGNEQVAIRGRGGRCLNRAGGHRGRRSQSHYSAVGGPTALLSSSAGAGGASGQDSADPIVEILAQLSGVRGVRLAGAGGAGAGATGVGGPSSSSNQSPASQLHQLQMHLQSSPSFACRNSNEVRIMRRTFQSMNNQLNAANSSSTSTPVPGHNSGPAGSYAAAAANSNHYCSSQSFVLMDQSSLGGGVNLVSTGSGGPNLSGANHHLHSLSNLHQSSALSSQQGAAADGSSFSSQYLLSKCMKPVLSEAEQQQREILKADRSLFVQELLLQIGLLERDK